MAEFFYNIFLFLFKAATHLASPFNAKADKWIKGRKHIFERLEKAVAPGGKIIWVHCASLGEFEQGRPVMEKLRIEYPGFRILLTFFSPSGYEVQKNFKGADWVFYLPMDSSGNAGRFLEIVKPSLVIVVKYDIWYYYLKKIDWLGIPLLLISAIFRKDMSFFQWYGVLQRKMLSRFDHLFVQSDSSRKLIEKLGLSETCSISGDTRFDRVLEIAERAEPIPAIEQFIGKHRAIIAGSTWPVDEEMLKKAFAHINDPSLRLIIAPHEVSEKHLKELKRLFPDAILYSQLASIIMHPAFANAPAGKPATSNILLIDNIGMLSRLYKYGYFTYVGGGLTRKGLHNVLEAAVYSKIVFFGPWYEKHSEAIDLVLTGGALPLTDRKKDGQLLASLIIALQADKTDYDFRSNAAGEFVRSNRGATQKIMSYIQEKRLLTS